MFPIKFMELILLNSFNRRKYDPERLSFSECAKSQISLILQNSLVYFLFSGEISPGKG